MAMNQEPILMEVSDVSIKCNSDLSYWWGPWKPDLKDRIVLRLSERFRKAGLRVVDNGPGLTILVEKIETDGWTGNISISKIVILVIQGKNEIFKVNYSQDINPFSLKGFFRPPKTEYQIADLLAKEILAKLKKISKQRKMPGT